MNTNETPGNEFVTPDPLTSSEMAGSGVASLDPPLVQQTKAEIRTLAAEIAELAHASVSPGDFYEGFLPRIVMAMGASAAGVWKFSADFEPSLVANHNLPSELVSEDSVSVESVRTIASEAHARVLKCAVSEGQPILVPPNTVIVDAVRPKNPLNDSLVIVPVRVEDQVEYAVEVVQRPSGGPAAQRGYLRFVAQMADLMSDFLRRHQLREYSAKCERVRRIEHWLLELAKQPSQKLRFIVAAEGLKELHDANQVILLDGSKVQSISGVRKIDSRSEIVLSLRSLLAANKAAYAELGNGEQLLWDPETATKADAENEFQSSLKQFSELVLCKGFVLICLNQQRATYALLFFATITEAKEHCSTENRAANHQISAAYGALLDRADHRSWSSWLSPTKRPASQRAKWIPSSGLIARFAICALATLIAVFPVPQQISATAILRPDSKLNYYSPQSAVVSEIFTSEGQEVAPGDRLVQLVSRELDHQLDELEGELQLIGDRTSQIATLLNRGSGLAADETDRLEGDLEQLKIRERVVLQSRDLLQHRRDSMLVVALEEGRIASWEVANRLKNKPVQAGELLLTSFQPNAGWSLQLSVPDYRIGLVAEAIESARQHNAPGALVRYSLSSHPDQLFEASLTKLASHATYQRGSHSDSTASVLGRAIVNPNELPIKKDGAIARATIECGTVPVFWLVVRDAYRAVNARIQMMW